MTVEAGFCDVCGELTCDDFQKCEEERERQRGQCDLCGKSEPHDHKPEEYDDPYPEPPWGSNE